ncbi:Ribosomal RNA small subunit methyltransferase E [Hordeum vulgare]|nr:Ribosomal RNA small subunit methyltransferase E [Hordeum vulgare]
MTRSSSPAGAGEVGVGIGVVVLGVGVAAVGVGDVVALSVDAVVAGPEMRFKMRFRSAKYQAFTYGSIVLVSPPPIRNARSVLCFFAATMVLRRSSLASYFIINADHLASDFSSLMAK